MRWTVEQVTDSSGSLVDYLATVEHDGRMWTAKHWHPAVALRRARRAYAREWKVK